MATAIAKKSAKTKSKKSAAGKSAAGKGAAGKGAAGKGAAGKGAVGKGAAANWGGISDEAVKKETGCDWEAWLWSLDKAGCAKKTHKEIAELIHERWPKIGGWWSQMVTVGYEHARGLRVKNQTTDGWKVSSSKTVSVPVKTLFGAWKDPKKRARWLKDHDFTVRKATEPTSMRITWVDGKTSVEAHFFAKGTRKSYVAVQHDKLSSHKEVEKMRAYWTKALDALKERLEA